MDSSYFHALLGGVLIGVAVSILLVSIGRVAGITGILANILDGDSGERNWSLQFLGGLFAGGAVLKVFFPGAFEISSGSGGFLLPLAGVAVGFGTLLGSGCTSGHGVCGISRLSVRSIIATITFIVFGAISVFVARWSGLQL